MSMTRHEFTAPSAWATYLMYGDETALEDDEADDIADWLESIDMQDAICLAVEEAGFIWQHDAKDYAGGADCCRFSFAEVQS